MAEMASLRVVNGELTPTTYVVFVLQYHYSLISSNVTKTRTPTQVRSVAAI